VDPLARPPSIKPSLRAIPVLVINGSEEDAGAFIASLSGATRPGLPGFSEQPRAIIRRDGRTIYAIGTAAGVPRGGVGRFLSGERGLTTDTLDRLAVVLGLRVVGREC
jgi:hypothetical protein